MNLQLLKRPQPLPRVESEGNGTQAQWGIKAFYYRKDGLPQFSLKGQTSVRYASLVVSGKFPRREKRITLAISLPLIASSVFIRIAVFMWYFRKLKRLSMLMLLNAAILGALSELGKRGPHPDRIWRYLSTAGLGVTVGYVESKDDILDIRGCDFRLLLFGVENVELVRDSLRFLIVRQRIPHTLMGRPFEWQFNNPFNVDQSQRRRLEMNDLVTLTYLSATAQILLLLITMALTLFTYHTLKSETLMEISHVSKLLTSTQASIIHAEIPFPLLATIAHLYNISLDEFQRLWINEKETRCRKVLEVYKKDYLTINFIEKFGSKFLLHGYVGSEALLTHGQSTGSTPSLTPHSTRSRRPARPIYLTLECSKKDSDKSPIRTTQEKRHNDDARSTNNKRMSQ